MRILQVITDPDRRGAQVFATDLGEALGRRGHNVVTVALGPASRPTPLPHRVLGPRRRSLATLRELRAELGRHDVAIAHGSTTLPACAVAAAGARAPWVYRQISESLFWAPDRVRQLRVGALLRRANLVVALAQSQADVLTAHFGVPAACLRVVPNGVPSERFPLASADERARARRTFGVAADDPDRFVVGSVGALAEEKGVDVAVEAVAAVPGVELLVAGDGPVRRELERVAARCAPSRIHFTGVLDDVRPAYAAADVVVLPSRGGDSMPAALIEAGLCGRPTIATDVGAIADVVVPGETGELVPVGDVKALADAIVRRRDDPARGVELGLAARRRCLERFDIDVVAKGWERALADAL